MNTLHRFAKVPERIVSLVPSITELLCDLGLADRIVGCTKFCVYPRHLRSRQKNIGGTKNPRLEKISDLEPDIILANKEENRREDVDRLRDVAPVWVSDVPSLEAGEDLIRSLAELFNAGDLGDSIIRANRASLAEQKLPQRKSALYLIWREPFMGAGRDTFIHDVMNRLGFDNVLANRTRYPEVETRELEDLAPQLILLSSEPYPFTNAHLEDMQKLFPFAEIRLVNGEYFSWYGSRIGHLRSIYVAEQEPSPETC
ncbi:helical backbone metal receptor [Lewinella sp. W8]|uniref:helical backbone metal receptor n=1 Tax=Lewinella sp. W8 TaxID=2528208 RepID=UPI0015673915|nr:helical backbone metal receptor [Lewinella sp. W8]